MTIVASEDSRNLHWSKNSIGSKLLLKMGWTEGTGLGRDRQGTAVALRAVRKHDSDAGIGATHDGADVTGNHKWNQTTDTFANVLKTLKSQHSSMSVNDNDNSDDGGNDDGSTKQKKLKKKKKKKLVLAQNKVNAGHSRKMREAKDLRNKSDADMAAIFGGVPNNRTTKTKKRSRSEPIVDSSPMISVAEIGSKLEEESKTEEVETSGQKLKKDKKRSKRKESKSKSSSNDVEVDNDEKKPKKKKRRKETKEEV
ncbi:glycine rich nucleic binding domain [Fragilaria crotonensis]|nr:glycine rich nucleic binding domain [Fragilaria crotonensis]